ncbi:MAG: DUF1501 domain-containing protein [bacterium]
MKRRDFLKSLPIGVAAAAVPFTVGGLFSGKAFGRSPAFDALLNSQTGTDNILVIINLQGGNDGLNTVIPFNDPIYRSKRADIGYVKGSEISGLTYTIRGDLALNPPLGSDFYNLYKAGKLAVIQNVGYANPDRSHFRATDIWNTASDSNIIVSSGWMGRFLETQVSPNYPLDVQKGDDPVAIQIDYSTSLSFQGSRSVMASAVYDPSNYKGATNYTDDPVLNNNYGSELGYVRAILTEADVYGQRFTEIFGKPDATKNIATYPTGNSLATQLQKVAWCIKGGLKTRVYFVTLGGFDTHVNQFTKDPAQGQGLLHKYLGEAIAAFQSDIEALGFGDNVLGMTYSEFGRRVNQNGSQGTDHGTAAPMFLFGKQVNGEVYGRHPNLTPNTPSDPTSLDQYGDLTAQFDFRQVYAALLTQWFGLNDNLRKTILNKPEVTTTSDFTDGSNGFKFPVNGSGLMQNLISNPAVISVADPAGASFELNPNNPNPFRGVTTINFALSEGGYALVEVFDSRGTLIATLVNGYVGRGKNQVVFDARSLPSGSYFVRLDYQGKIRTQQINLIK